MNINSAVNTYKMLLTFCRIWGNLIMLDGPYFRLRQYNNTLLNESFYITFNCRIDRPLNGRGIVALLEALIDYCAIEFLIDPAQDNYAIFN